MKTDAKKFSATVNFVLTPELKRRMTKACIEAEQSQAEWLRDAIKIKLKQNSK